MESGINHQEIPCQTVPSLLVSFQAFRGLCRLAAFRGPCSGLRLCWGYL